MRRAILTGLILVSVAMPGGAAVQRKGEYITPDEMALVQDVRRIDSRAKVFLRIADRRLIAIEDPNAQPKDSRFQDFGPLPKGSQIELLDDYRRAVDELMAKLDDEFERTGMTRELYAALTFTKTEIGRQIGVLDALTPKLTQPDAVRFAKKAREAAVELDEGTSEALSSQSPPPKPK